MTACPGCGRTLRVTHSYKVQGGRTQTAVCDPCDKTYTAVTLTLVVQEAAHGKGAYALAKRLKTEGRSLDPSLLGELGQDEG